MDIPAHDGARPLTGLERVAAAVTLRDDDALAAGPARERHEAIHDLILLVLIFLLELILWFTVFVGFGIVPFAGVPVAMLIATIIVALDVRMTASDTAPRGVLRRGPPPRAFLWMLGARVIMSFLLAQGTAMAVDLTIFRSEALQIMARDRDAQNAPIIAEYDRKLAALRANQLGPVEDEIADLTRQRAHVLADQTQAMRKTEQVQAEAANASLDAEREVNGVDRRRGDGPLAKDARKRAELAAQQAQFLAGHRQELGQDADRLGLELAGASRRLAQAQPQYEEAARELENEKKARLVEPTAGPLTVLQGLLKLRKDREQGPAVWAVASITWATIMVLELGFFLVRSVFKAASIHDLAVNMDLQRRAARLAHLSADELRELRRRNPLRVVTDDQPAEEGLP